MKLNKCRDRGRTERRGKGGGRERYMLTVGEKAGGTKGRGGR